MAEQLTNDLAVIYKIFCNVSEELVVDLSSHDEARFNQEDAFESAFDYVEDLYEEGIGEDVTSDQIDMLSKIAICNKAWFVFEDDMSSDERNFND